jgi:hypothetical protein
MGASAEGVEAVRQCGIASKEGVMVGSSGSVPDPHTLGELAERRREELELKHEAEARRHAERHRKEFMQQLRRDWDWLLRKGLEEAANEGKRSVTFGFGEKGMQKYYHGLKAEESAELDWAYEFAEEGARKLNGRGYQASAAREKWSTGYDVRVAVFLGVAW